MLNLTSAQWVLAVMGAAGIGVSKSGFSGVSMLHVLVFAFLFGARESTGIVLPMLVVGDILAVIAFRQHARWDYIRRVLPPAVIGIVCGTFMMQRLPDGAFRPVIGIIILFLSALQLLRLLRPALFERVPHHLWFAWAMGLLAGVTTMLANAAGPIMALYLLAVALPKYELVGTSAWLFLIINILKLPFSLALGLIHPNSLLLNAVLIPAVALGLVIGRWCVARVSQRIFDVMLLGFASLAALRLVGAF